MIITFYQIYLLFLSVKYFSKVFFFVFFEHFIYSGKTSVHERPVFSESPEYRDQVNTICRYMN